jgi:hypothetical protein
MNQPKVTLALDLDRVHRMGQHEDEGILLSAKNPEPLVIYAVQGDQVNTFTFHAQIDQVLISATGYPVDWSQGRKES